MTSEDPLSIAIVGGGVAGITAAHILQKKHRVTLFEKGNCLGGHAHTVLVPDGPDAGTAIDTGFIVLNDRTYPAFHQLLDQWGVGVRGSDMSFGYECKETGLQYASTNLNGLFAQRGNLLNPSYFNLLREIVKFGGRGRRDLAENSLGVVPLREYVAAGRYSKYFQRNYLIPLAASIWSASQTKIMDFPASTFLNFFNNYGLLNVFDRPQWQTIIGGSRSYVESFEKSFSGKISLRSPVAGIRRGPKGVYLRTSGGVESFFDRVVLASHADEALGMLPDATQDERALLGSVKYSHNRAFLHTDESCLPSSRRVWASWNYRCEKSPSEEPRVSVTSHMNRLQGLKASKEYFVTLNPLRPIREDRIIREMVFMHPIFSTEAVAIQSRMPSLNGFRNTYFCGSYFLYGFHEDAVLSALAVGRKFGAGL